MGPGLFPGRPHALEKTERGPCTWSRHYWPKPVRRKGIRKGEGREGEKQAAEWQVRLLHAPSTGLVRMRMSCLPRAWQHVYVMLTTFNITY